MKNSEIAIKIEEAKKTLFEVKQKIYSQEIKNINEIKNKKKEIARLLTSMNSQIKGE